MDQKLGSMNQSDTSKRSINFIILSITSGMLLAVVIAGFALFYSNEKDRLQESIRDKSHRVLQSIEASHTQSMIYRGSMADNNPVILALNDSLEQLSAHLINMNIWLIMGPKVLDFQRAQGSNEVEPPQDSVDQEAIDTLKPVGRFIDETTYRYTMPVVLGQKSGGHPICYTCHGEGMGIKDGEPIGGFSIAYDASEDLESFHLFMIERALYILAIVIITSLLLVGLLRKFVTKPIADVASAMRSFAENGSFSFGREARSLVTFEANSRELSDILAAIDIFDEQSKGEKKWILDTVDHHSITAMTDVKGTIVYVNQKFCEISGYSEEELLGQNHRILNSGYHSAEFFSEMYARISKGNVWQGEICNRAKDGSQYWVDTTIAPILNKDGKPKNYIAIRTDITSLKSAEKHAQEARVAAEQSAQAKSEFLANMSHEIRTPMNGVLGMLEILKKTDLNEAQLKQADVAFNSAKSLLGILNDILDFSKIESNKLDIEEVSFDIHRLFDELGESYSMLVEEQGLEFIVDTLGINQRIVVGDPGRLRQILVNLIGNAIKFTSQGEIVVKAALRMDEQLGLMLDCSVSDTGIGIPKDKQSHLFSAFSQADSSTTRKYGGTGLGLTICTKLCELMGGRISLESEEGKGSVFAFTLCLKEATHKNRDKMPQADLSELNILVVDDNETNREVLRNQVSLWGATVNEACDAEQALRLLHGASFDIALIDMQMPGMTGKTLGQKIRADKQFDSMKLVMMSSMTSRGDARMFSDIGFQAYLPKPLSMNSLAGALRVLADGQEALAHASPLVTPHYIEELQSNDEVLDRVSVDEPGQQVNTREAQTSRILLVEDALTNQQVVLLMLEDFDYDIVVANNGLEGLDALKACSDDEPFDLIIMDCQMPEMDGYEASRAIREGQAGEHYRKIPILAMTANAMKGDREKCLEAGMDDYLAKPIDGIELINTVGKCLSKQ